MSNRAPFFKRRSVQVSAVVIAVPILALAWWLGSPLFIDQVVDEPFPRAAMAVIPDDMTAEEVEQAMLDAEVLDQPVDEDMPEPEAVTTTLSEDTPDPEPVTTTPTEPETDDGTEETTPMVETTTMASAATTQPAGDQPEPEEEQPEPEEPAEPESVGPVAVATGSLMDGDDYHKGSGQVTLYRLEDGSHVVRLEDIEVTNGPDLHVILTPLPEVTNRNDVHAEGYLDLGQLKGNIGSQNYPLPPGHEPADELTVVIYCVPFRVVFATAPLV